MYLQDCLPDVNHTSRRTMDHLRGAVEATTAATAEVATDPEPTPSEVTHTEEPPAKRRAT